MVSEDVQNDANIRVQVLRVLNFI